MQSDVFSVIADPTRRNIVHLLAEQTRTVGAVVEHLNMSQPTISKHLKVLREARAVTVLVEGQRRLYSLNPEVFDEITAWVADIQAIAHSTKEQRESQIKQASVIEVVDVVESSGDDTAKTERLKSPVPRPRLRKLRTLASLRPTSKNSKIKIQSSALKLPVKPPMKPLVKLPLPMLKMYKIEIRPRIRMRPPSPLNPRPSLSSLSRRLRNVYPRPFRSVSVSRLSPVLPVPRTLV